jgi:hypothetical protein
MIFHDFSGEDSGNGFDRNIAESNRIIVTSNSKMSAGEVFTEVGARSHELSHFAQVGIKD